MEAPKSAPKAKAVKNPVQEEGVKKMEKKVAPKETVIKVLKIAGTIAASFTGGLLLGLWAGKRSSGSGSNEVVPFNLED